MTKNKIDAEYTKRYLRDLLKELKDGNLEPSWWSITLVRLAFVCDGPESIIEITERLKRNNKPLSFTTPKPLQLNLCGSCFLEIYNGTKKEEYREISLQNISKIFNTKDEKWDHSLILRIKSLIQGAHEEKLRSRESAYSENLNELKSNIALNLIKLNMFRKPFKSIIFSNGHGNSKKQFEIRCVKDIGIGFGNIDYNTNPESIYFKLSLGKVIGGDFE